MRLNNILIVVFFIPYFTYSQQIKKDTTIIVFDIVRKTRQELKSTIFIAGFTCITEYSDTTAVLKSTYTRTYISNKSLLKRNLIWQDDVLEDKKRFIKNKKIIDFSNIRNSLDIKKLAKYANPNTNIVYGVSRDNLQLDSVINFHRIHKVFFNGPNRDYFSEHAPWAWTFNKTRKYEHSKCSYIKGKKK